MEHAVSAGIYLRSLGEGLVPLYEEHAVRLERNIDIQTWMRLDVTEKALMVAAHRLRIAIDNLQSEAQIEHAENEAKK